MATTALVIAFGLGSLTLFSIYTQRPRAVKRAPAEIGAIQNLNPLESGVEVIDLGCKKVGVINVKVQKVRFKGRNCFESNEPHLTFKNLTTGVKATVFVTAAGGYTTDIMMLNLGENKIELLNESEITPKNKLVFQVVSL